jgi:hemolysin III
MANKLLAQGYSMAEEIANSVSHGIGLIFGIIGLVLLLVQAGAVGADVTAITSYSLYGSSMILLFLASTLYHAIPHPAAKRWLKKIDHCAIYLLIAGTYTPFLLVGLASPLAKGLMIVIWSMALFGVIFKMAFAHRFEVMSLITYLTMGWLSLVVIYQLAQRLPVGGLTLLALGGVIYTVGVIFYACNRIPFCAGRQSVPFLRHLFLYLTNCPHGPADGRRGHTAFTGRRRAYSVME